MIFNEERFVSIFVKNAALQGLIDAHMADLAACESLSPETIRAGIEAGTMVLLGNPRHRGCVLCSSASPLE